MSNEELIEILRLHKLWTQGSKEGKRADLSEANLSGTNLSGTNLRGADLRGAYLDDIVGKDILTFQFNRHFAYYCDGQIKIGCMTKSIEEWLNQYKEIGMEKGYTDLEIKMYGKFIEMCRDNTNE